MDKVDVTLPMLIDNAVLEYSKTTEKNVKEFGISYEIAEIALEKALFELKNRRLKLYANAAHKNIKELEKVKKLEERSVENGVENN